MSYVNMRLKEAVLCETRDCLSGFSLCVRAWVLRSCFACLLDGLKYVNILSVLEGMTYQNFGKSSMQRTHQDCCRYYVNVLDGS